MITICMNDRQHVITDVWAAICMSGNQSMYLTFQGFFFCLFVFFNSSLKLLLLYFSSAQINQLYDVYDSVFCFIIEKLCRSLYND